MIDGGGKKPKQPNLKETKRGNFKLCQRSYSSRDAIKFISVLLNFTLEKLYLLVKQGLYCIRSQYQASYSESWKILYKLLINVCFFLSVPGKFWNFCCFITFAGLCAINHGVYTVFHDVLAVSSQTPLQTDLFLILLNLLPTCLNIPSALIFISASPHFIFIQILQPI